MILDSIISFIALLFYLVAEGFALLFNLLAAAIEFLVQFFVSGFKIGRISRKSLGDLPRERGQFTRLHAFIALGCLTVFCSFILVPLAWRRQITFKAEDGQTLPFAALIIHTSSGSEHKRTDVNGNVTINRFGTKSIAIADPRYDEKKWDKSEIKAELIVSRSLLGSSLDTLATKFFQQEEKDDE